MSVFNEVGLKSDLLSALGTLETGELTPTIQMDWVYGINTQTGVGTASGAGATVDTSSSRLRLQSGTANAGYAYFLSKRSIRYRPGQGITARFTPVFTTGVANNIQAIGIGTISSNAINDGFFFGFNGTSFGICHANAGVLTWTAQASWNGNTLLAGAFVYDPTKGTPCMIKYPYLGFGDIFFYIQHPTTGKWVLVHTIRYANTVATVQLSNPALNCLAWTGNTAGVSNMTMYVGSFAAFISGARSFNSSPKWAIDSRKTGITTELNLLSLKNCTTLNGVTNRALLRLNALSVASSATSGNGIFRFKRGVTLGGSPSYTPINGSTGDNGATLTSANSAASYDTAGTTITGGTFEFVIVVDNPNSQIIDLTPFDIFVAPGEILTISAESTSSSAMIAGLCWTEDL